MTEVNTGAWWALLEKLTLLAGDLHVRGELTEKGVVELWAAIAEGSYRYGVRALIDEGVIPPNPGLVGEELPPPTLKA